MTNKEKINLDDLKYEDALKQLSIIVEKLERGDIPLEETIKEYEKGQNLLQFCKNKLSDAEGKLQKLNDDGSLTAL